MARLNAISNKVRTYEGAPAVALTPEQTLERSVMACLLWEKQFYESGQSIGDRIEKLASEVSPVFAGLRRSSSPSWLTGRVTRRSCGTLRCSSSTLSP